MNGQVLAISGDDEKTMGLQEESERSISLHRGPKARLIELFDVKYPFVDMPSRHTFVVGPGRKIVSVFTGSDAMDARKAIGSCLGLGAPKK